MKKETIDKILLLLLGLLIGLLIIMIAMSNFLSKISYSLQFKVNGYTPENAIAICSGENLEKTSYCLNSFISSIYKYESRKDIERPSFTELVEEGGDCLNWEMLTCELATKIGYGCTKVSIPVEKKENIQYKHTFAIIHNSEGYAKFDGKGVNIFIYKQ